MRVHSGLERFVASPRSAAGLADGARVGLVAHPSSVSSDGRHAVDLLAAAGSVRLVRLFAPEHGIRGEAQDMEAVAAETDAATGIPVTSLYGSSEASLRPRAGDLDGLDAIVYDLQDVGSRYYTFVYTMSYLMEAAAEVGIPIIVLDRPNPIGGVRVEGPVLEEALASFVGRFPIPVRHGMTTAELALLFRDAFDVRCDLRLVAMEGWRRDMPYGETGLLWVAPSPNMPTLDTAEVYPGGCLVEGTNLSEGRGTTRPFERVGAPWLEPRELADALRDAASREGLQGFVPRADRFRPMFQKHAGRSCGGVQVHVTDPHAFRPFETYLIVLREAIRLAKDAFAWRRETYEFVEDRLAIDLLLGRADLRPMIEAGATVGEMHASWKDDLDRFTAIRSRFLSYR